MKNILIDGNEIKNAKDIHTLLATQLDFGRYYGNNLDALWDMLSTNVERPFTITWRHAARSKEVLAADFDLFLNLFKKVGDFDLNAPWTDQFKIELHW